MENKDDKIYSKNYYTDVKGTGVISVLIFGAVVFTLMIIFAHFM